jgi:hypothetical protein
MEDCSPSFSLIGLWPWMRGHLFTLRVLVCSQLVPVLPLGGCISMNVVAHNVVVFTYCFSVFVADSFTVLQVFTVMSLSHY